jgi:hypothetical protein
MEGDLALAWAGFEANDRTVESFFDLIYAKNLKDTQNALEKVDSFSFSFLFATVLFFIDLIG